MKRFPPFGESGFRPKRDAFLLPRMSAPFVAPQGLETQERSPSLVRGARGHRANVPAGMEYSGAARRHHVSGRGSGDVSRGLPKLRRRRVIHHGAAWVVIPGTGVYAKALYDFAVGVIRGAIRTEAWLLRLADEDFSPFTLEQRITGAPPRPFELATVLHGYPERMSS